MYVGVLDEKQLVAKELYDVWSKVITDDILHQGFKAHHQSWVDLPKLQREAWIAVAKFVMELAPPQVVVFNNATLTEYDREQLKKQLAELPDHR